MDKIFDFTVLLDSNCIRMVFKPLFAFEKNEGTFFFLIFKPFKEIAPV